MARFDPETGKLDKSSLTGEGGAFNIGREISEAEDRYLSEGMTPGADEQKLLDFIGKQGLAELEKLFSEGFTLDDQTRAQIEKLAATQRGAAESALQYGLERAGGLATAGAAARGLPRGSVRNELLAKFGAPAMQQFQQQMADIETEKSRLSLQLPRTDFAIRQQALQSPALTALQRTRLANAELRFRLHGLRLEERAMKQQEGGALGEFFGGLAGVGVDVITGNFLGGAQKATGTAMKVLE